MVDPRSGDIVDHEVVDIVNDNIIVRERYDNSYIADSINKDIIIEKRNEDTIREGPNEFLWTIFCNYGDVKSSMMY